ncbi:MAG: ATP synthase F1 subunit epsilon [Clostridia bacterium]|nr:ATP synthase F1 subunit epsilon [Clostridia bacterium]
MPDQTIKVEVVTPYAMFYESDAEMVVFTSKNGEIGVMPGHAPLMAALVSGEIRILADGQWTSIAATNGYAEVGPELVVLVVNAAEYPRDISLERAHRALERAEQRLHDPDVSDREKARSRHGVERARNRIRLAEKYQRQQTDNMPIL